MRRLLVETAAAVAVGGAGAAVFAFLGFPAPFLTGPAVAVTFAVLAGARLSIPVLLRNVCFLTLGIHIGSSVTPEVLQAAATWPLSFAFLAATLVLSLVLCRLLLEKYSAFDRLSALLASTPGHMSYILGLSTDLRTDIPRIAVVQSMRVLFLTLLVPALLTLWGVEGDADLPSSGQMMVPAMALLAGSAIVASTVLARIGTPAAWMLGGMLVSSVGHASGLSPGLLPAWLSFGAFTVMGTLIGTRFKDQKIADLRRNLAAGIAVTLAACGVAAAGAFAVAALLDLSPALLLISFAPGGVEVMAAMAVQIGVDPTFVAAHHVFRLLILSALIPVLVARATKAA